MAGFFVGSDGRESMLVALLVFAGGGLGAVARHGVNLISARWLGTDLPWGTFIVNVVGSIAMGLLAGWFAFRAEVPWSQEMRVFLTTGFLGGFTTFSAFSLDTALLIERGAPAAAAVYVAASVLLAVLGLFLGLWLVRAAT
jgi:CrcB protein